MTEHEPPPDELRDLFDAERAAPTIDPATRSSWRSRLAATVAGTPLGHAAAGSALAKVLAILAITAGVGTGAVAVTRHASAEAPRFEPAMPVASVEEPQPIVARVPAHVDAPPPPPRMVVRAPAPAPVPEVVAPVPSEPVLLRTAWLALSSGEADRALAIVAQDAQLHPDGVLAEEREAVEVVALAKLHRTDEASAAASQFIDRHPSSVHRALVTRAITVKETP